MKYHDRDEIIPRHTVSYKYDRKKWYSKNNVTSLTWWEVDILSSCALTNRMKTRKTCHTLIYLKLLLGPTWMLKYLWNSHDKHISLNDMPKCLGLVKYSFFKKFVYTYAIIHACRQNDSEAVRGSTDE